MVKAMQSIENRIDTLENEMYRVASILLKLTEIQKELQDDLIKVNMKINLLHEIDNE